MILGGMMVISDKMPDYSPEELDDLFMAFEIFEKTSASEAVVLDLLEKKMPQMVYNKSGHLAVFNFSGKEREQALYHPGLEQYAVQDVNAVDVHSGERMEISKTSSITLPSHGSRLLKLE